MQIWKYEIPIEDRFNLELPAHAHILSMQIQNNKPYIWVMVDPSNDTVTRKFRLAGTGHQINESILLLKHIGTFQLLQGSLVFHLFEINQHIKGVVQNEGH